MAKKKTEGFKDLEVYTLSVDLAIEIYKTVDKLPKSENYGIRDQLTRAVNSIGANIAEGYGRYSYKEFIRFLYISRGSLMETLHFLNISLELGYIQKEEFDKLSEKIKNLGIKLNNLISAISKNNKNTTE